MIQHPTETGRAGALFELAVAGSALLMLLAAQWMLSGAIPGTQYSGLDGKIAQAIIKAALKYAAPLAVNTINPVEGVGSQMQTMNVWVNPAYWPFAWLDREAAANLSGLVALGVFMIACYTMARCFDMPIVPSALAAQLCILLFAPALLIVSFPAMFCLTPGNAVVYAPQMIALGLLARIEPGSSWRRLALLATGIVVLTSYGVYLDPMWSMVNGFAWAVAFAIVTIGPFRLKAVLLRSAALGSFGVLLLVSGAASYLYTLSQYIARVHYPALLDRPRNVWTTSALAYPPAPHLVSMRTFYLACAVGWLVGLLTLRGRPRVLAAAAATSFAAYLAYAAVHLLLLNTVWVAPIPLYVEHSLFALYIAGAIAGYWGVLRAGARIMRPIASAACRPCAGVLQSTLAGLRPAALFRIAAAPRSLPPRLAALGCATVLVGVIPAVTARFAMRDAAKGAATFQNSWPDEPELAQFLGSNVGSGLGQPLRGSIAFWTFDHDTGETMANLLAQGMHSIDEYSQLVTPQSVYFLYAYLKQNEVLGSLNGFVPFPGPSWENFGKAMQLFGMRYYLTSYGRVPANDQSGYPLVTLPRRPFRKEPGLWYVYEYPRPNVGNYSPTEITTARSGPEIVAKMSASGFDFAKQAVLSAPLAERLVEARHMRMSRIRGGWRVSGQSERTSLVVLPLQFSHCLRATDSRVRFVRADLMMAGMVFSGNIDTDIIFDYGIFSPGCRRDDIRESRQLDLRIDLRMPHLTGDRVFPDWDGTVARLREIGMELQLVRKARPP
jgi:hypothetical protein